MRKNAILHALVAFLVLSIGLTPAASSSSPPLTTIAQSAQCSDYEYLRDAIATESGLEALFGMDFYMGAQCVEDFAGGLVLALAAGFAAPAGTEPCVDIGFLPSLPQAVSGSLSDITANELLGQAFGASTNSNACVSLSALLASCQAVQVLVASGLSASSLRCDLLLSSSGAAGSISDSSDQPASDEPSLSPIVDCTVRQLVVGDVLEGKVDGAGCLQQTANTSCPLDNLPDLPDIIDLSDLLSSANIAIPCVGDVVLPCSPASECVPPTCPTLRAVPGMCGTPLPCSPASECVPPTCPTLRAVPGFCGTPLPSDDPCDYLGPAMPNARINLPCGGSVDECDYLGGVPGRCGNDPVSTDPCDYVPTILHANSNIALPCGNTIDECDYLGDVPGQCENPPLSCDDVYGLIGEARHTGCVPDYCKILDGSGSPVTCSGDPVPCEGTKVDAVLLSACVPDYCQYFDAELPVSCGGESPCDGTVLAPSLLSMQVCVPDHCPYLGGMPVTCADGDTEPCPGYGVNAEGYQACAPDHCPYLRGNPVLTCDKDAEPCEGLGTGGQGFSVCVPEPCAFIGSGTVDSNLPICETDCDKEQQVNAPGFATYCLPNHCDYIGPLIPPPSDEPIVGTGGSPADAKVDQLCGLSAGHVCYVVRLVAAVAALAWGPPPSPTSLYYGVYVCGLYPPQTVAMVYNQAAPIVTALTGPAGSVAATALGLVVTGHQTLENALFGAPQRPSPPNRGGPQAAAGGEWHVVIGRGLIAANSLPDGEDNAPAGITVPLAIPDQGTISQRTVPTPPPTPITTREHKPNYVNAGWQSFQCAMGAIATIPAGALIVGGAAHLDPAMVAAGALLMTAAVGTMASACPAAYKELSGGHYWCAAAAGRVDWGYAGGNNYAGGGSLIALPYYSSSVHDGGFTQSFPYGPAGSDGSWAAGKRACQEAYQAALDAVTQAASEFMTTNHLEGDASLTFVVQTPNVEAVPGAVIGELRNTGGEPVGALLDVGSDVPVVLYYCGSSCPLSLEIIVSDCGPAELVGKTESVSYKFTGSGSCFKISIKKDGQTVVPPTPVPFLALDGEFEGPA